MESSSNSHTQPISHVVVETVGVLPSSLQSLVFGRDYNQRLSVGVLPSTLQSLVFGGVLPTLFQSPMQSLMFGSDYNQRLSVGELPSSLQSLEFGDSYNHPITLGVLPSSLQSLKLGNDYNQPLSFTVLPSSLHSLKASNYDIDRSISIQIFPSSETQSILHGWEYNDPMTFRVLPSSLQSITFGDSQSGASRVHNIIDLKQPVELPLSLQIDDWESPTSFKKSIFRKGYNQPVSMRVLPSSLQSLTFGHAYTLPLSPGVLPESLQSLVFGDRYNQALSIGVLPPSLQSLKFGRDYNQPLSVGVLPTSLQSLEFGRDYNQTLPVGVLPSSLQSLTFSGDSKPIVFLVDFKQSITVSRYFIKLGSHGIIKLRDRRYPLILSASPSEHHIDIIHILRNNTQQPITYNTNPNSINYDPNYIMKYPIKVSDFVSVNNKKYFVLHSFPYSSNKVLFVSCESSGELFVYKEIDYFNKKENEIDQKIYDKVQFEISTMKLFINDDMFVQYKDHQDDSDSKKIYLLTHFCEGGDLEQLFQSIYKWNESQQEKQKVEEKQSPEEYKYISESEIWRYIRRIFQILEKLSQHNLAHLDIKPLNIFIRNDGEIVLGDFGSCHYFVDQNHQAPKDQTSNPTENVAKYSNMIALTRASRGTYGYYSPEKKKKYYASSDIYSVGSTILHLLSCHPDDSGNRKEFINNHKKDDFNADHIKISPVRYSEDLIQFVKNLLIETPHDRLSLDDLNGETVNQHTQRITSFLINQRQILSSTTTLILDGEFNSPLNGLLPPTLLKLKFMGKFNQPIKDGDIPEGVETLIFGPSFNQPLTSSSLKKNTRIHLIIDNDKSNFILTIGKNSYGIGRIKKNGAMLEWKNNNIRFSINLEDVKMVSDVKTSIYRHLFCQIDKSKFEEINSLFGQHNPSSEYLLMGMEKLFELDQDNIYQESEQGRQYLNIRLIFKPL
ncbi:hypothetical protein DFA_06851 [Cavenderia fasciculata]|uniref:Protein kinase domain-containing protein n=1 Tax=Cavenderia fasciculata TaxID=261658 RepID=F4PWU8_CACFS|nr:uncharacterized protein DFA_06851 [Cavenderia fasciculata]EGG19751.1 hypothetical protein DFA_06851 [Cavenderia fasciculata]|eukprot:XP_004358097.1 hypothetical protein DFA_06851 [Cavenderia fasciculata]